MKLTIKTLQQTTFKVDIEPDKSVKELKDKIEQDHGKDYPSGAQKLIYSGKILADECKLSEYDIDEKKFVVLMITRPPPAPKPPSSSSTEKSSVTTKKDEPSSGLKTKAAEDNKPKQSHQTTTTTQQSSSSSVTSSASSTTTAPTTTPSVTATTQQQQASAIGNRTTGGGNRPSSDVNELSMNEPQIASRLASLMQQPQFRQIQDLIQQSPHLLSSTIEALAGSDPEMYNFISENPDIFVSALNHPPLSGGRVPSSRSSSTTSGQPPQQQTPTRQSERAPTQDPPGIRNPTGGRQPVAADQWILDDVSERDKEAIERLKELGFSEYLAVQAYMACDKDEQLAANLLFQMDQ